MLDTGISKCILHKAWFGGENWGGENLAGREAETAVSCEIDLLSLNLV